MRSVKELAAIAAVIFFIPFIAATANALPPSGFRTVEVSEFKPVVLPPMTHADQAMSISPTPRVALILETFEQRDVPTLAPRIQPQPTAAALPKAAANPKKQLSIGDGRVRGVASWYCNFNSARAVHSICPARYPDRAGVADYYAAAGPRLRVAMGGGESSSAPQPWRGDTIHVCGKGTCINVRLVDWCQCSLRKSTEKVIDLFYDAFLVVGSSVTITW